jgi:hypothetical protein
MKALNITNFPLSTLLAASYKFDMLYFLIFQFDVFSNFFQSIPKIYTLFWKQWAIYERAAKNHN